MLDRNVSSVNIRHRLQQHAAISGMNGGGFPPFFTLYAIVNGSGWWYDVHEILHRRCLGMSQSAFIYFVEGSSLPSISLDELKQALLHYKDQLALTGQQLDWQYDEAGFPYTIETKPESEGKWFYLKGKLLRYKFIVMGTGAETASEKERHYVQVVLPDEATHGDKAKANELCKYFAKQWKAELRLFNGRTMYYNPRK
jgi:hypothetical protein